MCGWGWGCGGVSNYVCFLNTSFLFFFSSPSFSPSLYVTSTSRDDVYFFNQSFPPIPLPFFPPSLPLRVELLWFHVTLNNSFSPINFSLSPPFFLLILFPLSSPLLFSDVVNVNKKVSQQLNIMNFIAFFVHFFFSALFRCVP